MRKAFVILIALFFINSSDAQVRFGLKAGGNLANMEGFDQSKIRLGISAGPVLQVNVAKMFFLQSELLYSIKGRQSDTTQNNSNATLSLNYINLPVLFGYRMSPNFSIKLGPEIGRLLSAKSKFDGSTSDVSNIYQDFDFGADLALAYAFKKLSIDLRYNYGLKDLIQGQFEDPNGNFIQEKSFGSNRVLQFSLCYFLK
jgi:hypothetical protein